MERCALVTGGSSGIGLAIARMLAAEGYGVTISGRRAEVLDKIATGSPGAMQAVVADVAREQDVAELVRRHAERFGRLDVLVNSAGISVAEASDSADTAEVDRQLAVNLRAPLLVTREALALLRAAGAEHGKALVVNLASVSGKEGQPGNTIYSATKAGVISLTQSLQRETAAQGIQATALCPGLVATPMIEKARVSQDEMVTVDDVTEAVRFLLRTSSWCLVPEIVLNRRGAVS
jgi:NAD(P)-dependent dehydrogenase (short-subunit alcohol dehydrogenase family)